MSVPPHGPAKLRRRHESSEDYALPWARKYRIKLRITDTILVVLCVFLSSDAIAESLDIASERLLQANIGVASVWLLTLWLWRTRDPRLVGVGPGEYKKMISASTAAFGWLAVLFLLYGAHRMSVAFLITMPVGTIALLIGRWGWRRWLTRQRAYGHYLSRVIVLGDREDVTYVVEQIHKKSGAAYEVVGVALEDPGADRSMNVGQNRIPIVASLDNICDAVIEHNADAVIVAGQVTRGGSYLRELGWKLEESATELVVALALTNVAGPRIQMRPVEGLPLMHVDLPQFTGYKHLLKRSLDIVASAMALLLLSPILVVLAIMIRKDSPGPVIFRQDRVGRDGGIFEMYKFRSMVANAEEVLATLADQNEGSGPLFKIHNDPRITKVGAWMRRYSLDELPQLMNVLKGQMSLVGPRPPLSTEVENYDGHTYRRLYIKPGITGLWQVSGRSDLSWKESVRMDLYYVENWSMTGDFMIMWRTLHVMRDHVGAY
ncbi:sugar transferase [Arthrobacter glacialis]|nr:sugar transferase [Arthrobacter glacialis]